MGWAYQAWAMSSHGNRRDDDEIRWSKGVSGYLPFVGWWALMTSLIDPFRQGHTQLDRSPIWLIRAQADVNASEQRSSIRFNPMSLAIALDTVAVRLLELANDGRWEDAKQEGGAEEALAMLRTLFYADVVPWLPRTVVNELKSHGSELVVADTEDLIDVQLLELPIKDPGEVEKLVERWQGKVASAQDSRWLAEVRHVGYVDVAVTFDTRLIRGVSGSVEGLTVCSPSSLWAELAIPRGETPRKTPAMGHPLYGVEDWRWI